MTNYVVILEPSSTGWGAWSPDLGVYATGETREATIDQIREAITFHIDGLKANGDPVPAPAIASVLVGA
jgi:predicted RNase H-like HicB family nuclease